MINPAFRTLCLSLSLTFSYQAAQADGVMFDGFAAQTAMTTMHNSVLQQRYGVKGEQESKAQAAEPAKANLTFTPSASDTRKNIAKFIKQSQTIAPAAAAQLEAAFDAKDMMGATNKALSDLGLSHTNVADV